MFDEILGKETPTLEKQNKISNAANKLADDFVKKFKGKEPKFYDKDGNEMQVFTSGISWNDTVEGIGEAIRQAGKVAQGAVDIAKVISDYLNNQKWFQDLDPKSKEIVSERIKLKY